MEGRALLGEVTDRSYGPTRERTGRGGIEMDGFAGGCPGKFFATQPLDVDAHSGQAGPAMSGNPAPRGTRSRIARGSNASRSASPRRLNPRTAAPIASPGASEVQGAVRS